MSFFVHPFFSPDFCTAMEVTVHHKHLFLANDSCLKGRPGWNDFVEKHVYSNFKVKSISSCKNIYTIINRSPTLQTDLNLYTAVSIFQDFNYWREETSVPFLVAMLTCRNPSLIRMASSCSLNRKPFMRVSS